MTKSHLVLLILCCELVASSAALADGPPPPAEVANTVSNLWISSQIAELGAYIESMYASHPDYVPALLAASFFDTVYRGRLSDASNKLDRVQRAVAESPESFSEAFRVLLSGVIQDMSDEIEMHRSMNTSEETLESNAAPATVRAACDYINRDLMILFYAPETNAP